MPGVIVAVLLLLVRLIAPVVHAEGAAIGLLGAVGGALLIVLWWLFLSRAPWLDRIGAIVLMVLALVAIRPLVHLSIAGGMMNLMPIMLGLPLLALGLVAGAWIARRASDRTRRIAIGAAMLIAVSTMTLVRTEGIRGGAPELRWRWTKTAEQRLLEQAALDVPKPLASAQADAAQADAATEPADATVAAAAAASTSTETPAPAAPVKKAAAWPGFRGPSRDSIVRGVRIATDWTKTPPAEIWRRPIGPGWSSFAVDGDVFYTQEQRGEEEIVSAHRVSTGEPLWRHADSARFYESNGGAGPRATPALHGGRVYTLGATGIVNALDARTGAVVWTRNAAADTGATMPGWGFTASPVVVDDAVIVAASGRLVAYDLAAGTPRWTAQTKGGSYSSPHLITIDGVPQILMLSGFGAMSLAPESGTALWEHAWAGVPIVQPIVAGNGDLIVSSADAMGGLGMRRLAVKRAGSAWTVEERWSSRGLKPYFNDSVINDGHVYGFDGAILSCINLEDGARKWKGGRYGQGQFLLLADQDLLLVLSEDGDLALVSATPDKYTELAKMPALNSKTWNHPVIAGGVLLVRNGEEMVAFKLPIAGT